MREFLRHPLFWLRDTLRWHWWEIAVTTAAVWFMLVIALSLLAAR